ncbi:MAG: PAS domain S-box protein [Bacteroidales bacterium]|nr:PAS domain S-box protein [Bacteroidales bacterium]
MNFFRSSKNYSQQILEEMNNDQPSYADLQSRIRQLEIAEINLSNQYKEMQWLFKSMLNAFVIFDSVFDKAGNFVSYRFVFINDAYEKITGVKNNEVKGKTIHEVWPETEQSWIEKYGHVAVTGETLVFEKYHGPTKKLYHCRVYRPWETKDRFCVIFEDITEKNEHQQRLQKIEWMLKPKPEKYKPIQPAYGDLSELNRGGLILQNIGKDILTDIVRDYLDLLDTSAAVYEANGDYALGIFSSEWCNLLDTSSRKLCGNCSNEEALASGKWLCHESCWTDASQKAIKTAEAVDVECNGGLHIYALPIMLQKQVIGAINFGYGNPPTNKSTIEKIGQEYELSVEVLTAKASKYEARPAFIIDIAKERLKQSARMISEIVSLNLAEKKIQNQNEEIRSQNEELTAQNEEIRKANFNLQKSEDKLQKLFNHMSSCFAFHKIVLDENNRPVDYIFKEVNTAFEHMTGLKAKDIIGKKVSEILPGTEKDPANWIGVYGKVALSGTSAKFLNYSAQLEKWFSVRAYCPIKGYFATIFEDITEGKLAEQKVNESEAKYRSYIDNAPHGIFVINEKGDYLDANPSAAKMTGYSIEEILQMNIADFNIEKNAVKLAGKRLAFIESEGKLNVKMPFLKKGGSIGWWQINAVKISESKILGFTTDITVQKNAEDALQLSESKYRQLVETASDAIYLISETGRILDVNNASCNMLGRNKEELQNIPISKVDPNFPVDNFKDFWEKIPFDQQIIFETTHKTKDGREIPVEVSGKKFSIGSKTFYYGIARNITDRKQAQENLIRAKEKAEESDRLKSAFLANMSHEIRTPMNGILGFASLLNEPGLSGEEQKKYTSIIEKSGARMLNIINDLIDISKIEAGQMEVKFSETNIHNQAEYLCTFFKPELENKGLKLYTHFQTKDARHTFCTDREKLYAIITNLLKNAIKYTNEGSIEMGFSFSADTHGYASLLQFYVKDTGIGIPQNRLEAVFERFVQADIEDKKAMEGAGLGLAISKAYVEMLGGKIWVESIEGKGSTFYFTIADQQKTDTGHQIDKKKSETLSQKITKKLKILVAEDDETSKMHLSIVIEEFAKEILYAKTGAEAVNLCRQNPDIDLVLMDIKLPVMNGYDATGEIRKFDKDVLIIAQTAYALSGDREKSIKAGCNDYIAKPIKKDLLLAIIEKYHR